MEKSIIEYIDPTGKSALESDTTAAITDKNQEKYFETIPIKKFQDFEFEKTDIGWSKLIYDTKVSTDLPAINVTDEYKLITDNFVPEMLKHKETYERDSNEMALHNYSKQWAYNRVEIKDRPENFEYEVSEKYDSYINANYICNMYYQEPKNKPIFIATQGPIKKSFGHFWRMVWQENTQIIVMLCKKWASECDQNNNYYFPESKEANIECSNFLIEFESRCMSHTFYIKIIQKITNKLTNEERIVTHYSSDGIPNFGVPSEKDFYGFKKLIEDSMKERDKNEEDIGFENKSPMVVHCMAGIGRTGLFIIIFELVRLIKTYQKYFKPLSKIEETNLGISVIGTLRALREQRKGMVERDSQYAYIYKFMKQYISEIYK